MKGKAQGHDISIVLSEFQGRDVLGQSRQIQLKEIDRELTVDVMELIFVLTVVFRKVRFVNILQVMQVERTPSSRICGSRNACGLSYGQGHGNSTDT